MVVSRAAWSVEQYDFLKHWGALIIKVFLILIFFVTWHVWFFSYSNGQAGWKPISRCISRWWFQFFLVFTPIWGRFPFWLLFFRWVETTNKIYVYSKYFYLYIYILVYVYDIFVVGWEHGIFDIKNPLGRSTIPPQPGMSPWSQMGLVRLPPPWI